MNITVLSLISYNLLSKSPLFVENQCIFNNCKFQKTVSVLFFNQKNLYLERSLFHQALNAIVLIDDETITNDQQVIIKNNFFQNTYQPDFKNSSLSIVKCTFTNIDSNYVIKTNNDVTLYFTNCFFSACTSSESGVLCLQQSRCLTMTHNCASQCKSSRESVFLYYDCVSEDFTLFLYNTIIDSERINNNKDGSNVFCKSGNQYYRCNNMTNLKSNAYKFDAPYCFSFEMNTVINCECTCFSITGNINQAVLKKNINNVNFFSNNKDDSPILIFSLQQSFDLTFENSVILAKLNKLVNYDTLQANLIFDHCIVNSQYDKSKAQFNENCIFVDFSYNHLTIHPHYTYKDVCIGPALENKKDALNCNAGNCVDLVCNRTIGFPNGVVGYSTIIHLDLQTATFTPTDTFTPSNCFSKSNDFSQSFKFSDSENFSGSNKFTKSNNFVQSSQFTYSEQFTFSSKFSKTSMFSESKKFSKSSQFLKTSIFSNSNYFSQSLQFSNSFMFSQTLKFTTSKQFSNSIVFSQSQNLFISKSTQFTESSEFTKSISFTKSSEFHQTDLFSKSSYLSESLFFSKSLIFQDSLVFTSSQEFSKTEVFSVSDTSYHFHYFSSYSFKQSDTFSMSSIFSKSNFFSHSSSLFVDITSSHSNFFIIDNKNPNSSETKSKSNKIPIIIGVSVAIAALIAGATVFICCFICVAKPGNEEEEEEEEEAIETINDYYIGNPLYCTDENSSKDEFISDFDEKL